MATSDLNWMASGRVDLNWTAGERILRILAYLTMLIFWFGIVISIFFPCNDDSAIAYLAFYITSSTAIMWACLYLNEQKSRKLREYFESCEREADRAVATKLPLP